MYKYILLPIFFVFTSERADQECVWVAAEEWSHLEVPTSLLSVLSVFLSSTVSNDNKNSTHVFIFFV